jgi:hypothetical protein
LRLTDPQQKQIHNVLSKYLKDIPYKLFLYGSRIHDHLKGGDIDLLVLTNSNGVELFNNLELDILVELKKQQDIGQRKIDIKAVTESDLESNPFYKLIAKDLHAI